MNIVSVLLPIVNKHSEIFRWAISHGPIKFEADRKIGPHCQEKKEPKSCRFHRLIRTRVSEPQLLCFFCRPESKWNRSLVDATKSLTEAVTLTFNTLTLTGPLSRLVSDGNHRQSLGGLSASFVEGACDASTRGTVEEEAVVGQDDHCDEKCFIAEMTDRQTDRHNLSL